MENLLQSQVKEYCKIVMPEGLKELMSDISREVLRAQPPTPDLYDFISKYLSALLVTREHLSIASRIYTHVCDSVCEPELEEELRYIGLPEEDVDMACCIIKEYFEEGGANESNLMEILISKTSMEPSQLPALSETVRRAFLRHQINNTDIYETLSESDEYSQAASHTLNLYRKTKPPVEEYFQKAITLQAAYRAYGVRRHCTRKRLSDKQNDKKNIRFHEAVNDDDRSKFVMATVSSVSLAGSHLNLPMYKPYSNHGAFAEIDELPEKEHAIIDYITEEMTIGNRNVDFNKELEDLGTQEVEIVEQFNKKNFSEHTMIEKSSSNI